MIKEHDPVEVTESISGSREAGAMSGGAEKGEKGFVVDLHGTPSKPVGYTIEIVMDTDGRGRLLDASPEQVSLDWRAYWSADKVKALRSQLGLTQREMGPLIWSGSPATARKNLADLECGATRPSASVARSLERLEDEGVPVLT